MATLSEIMTGSVYTTTAETTVAEAAKAMMKGRFGSAVVMVGDHIEGIFTERDVLRAAAAGADPSTSTVGKWMTPDPETATGDVDSEDACATMLSMGFRHLPVLDGDTLVGIVSLRDVLSTRIASR